MHSLGCDYVSSINRLLRPQQENRNFMLKEVLFFLHI